MGNGNPALHTMLLPDFLVYAYTFYFLKLLFYYFSSITIFSLLRTTLNLLCEKVRNSFFRLSQCLRIYVYAIDLSSPWHALHRTNASSFDADLRLHVF